MNLGDSYSSGKNEAIKYILSELNKDIKVLDVGAGCGTYGCKLATKGFKLDAVEIWEPAVEHLKKLNIYENVYNDDIRTFKYKRKYNIIIFGDIIEHLTVDDAQKVLKEAEKHTKAILVAVPYLYKQDALYGNEAERHLQEDLTPQLFNERYPGYTLIWNDDRYGYYYKVI